MCIQGFWINVSSYLRKNGYFAMMEHVGLTPVDAIKCTALNQLYSRHYVSDTAAWSMTCDQFKKNTFKDHTNHDVHTRTFSMLLMGVFSFP